MTGLRRRVRSGLDGLTRTTGLLALHERGLRRGLTILMYHRILPAVECASYPLPSLAMPREAFEAQVAWLAEHCRVVPVAEALGMLGTSHGSPRPLVSLTFDDGYADNAEIAAPVLHASGVRGTFFITTGFVEQAAPLWFDRAADAWSRLDERVRGEVLRQLVLASGGTVRNGHVRVDGPSWMASLKAAEPEVRAEYVARAESLAAGMVDAGRYAPMTVDQVKSLASAGHEVAAHSVSHPILPQLPEDAMQREVSESAGQIEHWTGRRVRGFCYPNGDFDARVERAVEDAGLAYACTTRSGLNRPGVRMTRLLRRPMTMQRVADARRGHSLIGFRAELSGLRERFRRSDA